MRPSAIVSAKGPGVKSVVEVGLGGRSSGGWGFTLKGDSQTPVLPLFALLRPSYECSPLLGHALPAMRFCLTIDQKAMGPTNHRLKPPKVSTKINLFSP